MKRKDFLTELRSFEIKALLNKISQLEEKLSLARGEVATGKEKNYHKTSRIRKEISQTKTILKEKLIEKLEGEKNAK